MKHKQKGFSVVEVLIVLGVVSLLGLAGWYVFSRQGTQDVTSHVSETSIAHTTPTEFLWRQTATGWQPIQAPPNCPNQPILKLPTDLHQVTSVLYPGQIRGGNYKPHGGLRFDTSTNNDITVTTPLDGFVVRGSQYLERGEVQYSFDIFNNCGIMYRLDHLSILSDEFKKLTTGWPAPQENSSQTHQVGPVVPVKQGDTVATAVGLTKSKNVFMDLGVYDFRQENAASKSENYQQNHQQDRELSWHAICWLDWLPGPDTAILKAFPAGDSKSGKTSDYCQN